jgi:hypothetical protein
MDWIDGVQIPAGEAVATWRPKGAGVGWLEGVESP